MKKSNDLNRSFHRGRSTFWLIALLAVSLSVSASDLPYKLLSDDVLTFSGGTPDLNLDGVYLMEMGDYERSGVYSLTINRPRGAEADYPVSVHYLLLPGTVGYTLAVSDTDNRDDAEQGGVLTIEAGESSKTLYIFSGGYEPNEFSNYGTAYLSLAYASRATLEYSMVQMNFTNPNPADIPTVTSEEDQINGVFFSQPDAMRMVTTGGYMLFSGYYENAALSDAYSEITAAQQLNVTSYQVDHANLDISASDRENAATHSFSLSPREVGSTAHFSNFLIKITEEAIISNFSSEGMDEAPMWHTVFNSQGVIKQANAEDIDNTVSLDFTDKDLSEPIFAGDISPRIGTITTDKNSYNSNDAVKISIPIENWKLYRKVGGETWIDMFRLTIDNGATSITSNKNFDEDSGTLSFSFNAPTVQNEADSTIYAEVEILMNRESMDDAWTYYPAGAFKSIKIHSATAPLVFTESISVSGLPDLNKIFLEKQASYQLSYQVTPLNSSFLHCTWTSSDPEIAEISSSGLLTAKKAGQVTITLTSDEVAYRQENGEDAKDDVLIRTFDILIRDAYPKLSGSNSWADMNKASTVDFYYNLKGEWDIRENKASVTIIHANGAVRTDQVTVDPAADSFTYTVPFNTTDFPQVSSERGSEGQWIPTAVVKLSMDLVHKKDTEAYTIESTANLYVSYQNIQLKAELLGDMLYGATMAASGQILYLREGFELGYQLRSNYSWLPIEEYTDGGSLPNWLTIEEMGNGYYQAKINVEYNTGKGPSGNGLQNTYYLELWAKDSYDNRKKEIFAIGNVVETSAHLAQIWWPGQTDNKAVMDRVRDLLDASNNADTSAFKTLGETIYEANRSNRIYAYPEAPKAWGDYVATFMEERVYSYPVVYPMDGQSHDIRAVWPSTGVEKKFSFTCYPLPEELDNLYFFSLFWPGEAHDEEFTLSYITGTENRKIVPIQKPEREGLVEFFIYEPDSIMDGITLLSNKEKRLPSPLTGFRKGFTINNNKIKAPKENKFSLSPIYENLHLVVHNHQGELIKDARINYVILDKNDKPIANSAKRVTYDSTEEAYLIWLGEVTGHRIFLEVIAEGYAPQPFSTNAYSWQRQQFNIVLKNEGRDYYDARVVSKIGDIDRPKITTLIDFNVSSPKSITVLEDKSANMRLPDGYIGQYPLLIASLSWDGNPEDLRLTGQGSSRELKPLEYTYYDKDEYQLENSYLDVEFHLGNFVKPEWTVFPQLKCGDELIVEFPGLMNTTLSESTVENSMDLELQMEIPPIKEADDRSDGRIDEYAAGFNDFDFTAVTGLPFTFQVSRIGTHYKVRGLVAVNCLPGGPLQDLAELAGDFEQLFNDCKKAANGDYETDVDINRRNSAFVGVRGWLEGVGTFNPETRGIDVTIGSGSIGVEASASYSHPIEFVIGRCGFEIKASLAASIGFENASVEAGKNDIIRMDVKLDTGAMLEIRAWAAAGLDIFIAKAEIGMFGCLRGTYISRLLYPTYDGGHTAAGHRFRFSGYLKAYAAYRVFFWGGTKIWDLASFDFNWYYENNIKNPLRPDYKGRIPGQRATYYSTRLLSSMYQPMSFRSFSALSPIIEHVGSGASPRYILDGSNLLFSNIKVAENNMDDRLQIYNAGSPADLTTEQMPSFSYDVASTSDKVVAAYEQLTGEVIESDVTDYKEEAAMKLLASKVKVVGMVYDGTSWHSETLSKNELANINPRAAVQKSDGKGAVLWSSGEMISDDEVGQYIKGELLLSRYNGSTWSQPIHLTTLDKNRLFSDYNLAMAEDTVLVIGSQRTEDSNQLNRIVFMSVSPDDKVSVCSSGYYGQTPQLKRMGDLYLASFVTQTADSTMDVRLIAVDNNGYPTGKTDHFAGLTDRRLYNVNVVASEEAKDLDDLAILWSEYVNIDDENNPENFEVEHGLYAAKFGKWEDKLFVSSPVKLMKIPEDHRVSSHDAQLKGLDIKVAATISDESNSAVIVEETASFENSFICTDNYISTEQMDIGYELPVLLTIQNTGYQPITSVEVTMNGRVTTTPVNILPKAKAEVTGYYMIPADFDGTIAYDIKAQFTPAITTLRTAMTRSLGQAVTLSATMTASSVDLSASILSYLAGESAVALLVEVDNNSAFAINPSYTVQVGLFADPMRLDEPYGGTAVVTIPVADLYSAKIGNISKVVAFTVPNVSSLETIYAVVRTMDGANEVTDLTQIDNYTPVQLYPLQGIRNPNTKTFTLTIPQVEGVTTDPASGTHTVDEDEMVNLEVYARSGYSLSSMVLKVNGVVVQPQSVASGLYKFELGEMKADMDVVIEGVKKTIVPPLANEEIEDGKLRVVTVAEGLEVSGLAAGEEFILYNAIGQTIYQGKMVNSPQFIPVMGKGIYFVVAKDKKVKVVY